MRGAACAVLLLAGPACAQAPPSPPEPISREVRSVIERTFDPPVDYSVVQTVEITLEGRTFTSISAEFERGTMHRVETLPNRALANCQTRDTVFYAIAEDRVERAAGNDSGACGIGSPEPVLSSRMLPPVTGAWGRADVIELTGQNFVRRYVVTADGIIVVGDWAPRRPDVGFGIHTLRVVVTRGSPDPAMFEEASLRRAFARPLPEDAPPAP